jgi:WD40 repeat protein/DNA polymerase III delta prime subunit/UDP-2,3-diacylglucosamine pyrophosphatase LpxH
MYILHLSDLHFGNSTEADTWYDQLSADLHNSLKVTHLDALILSGDIANYCTIEEYKVAEQFLKELCQEFSLNPDQITLAPGNHDIDWRTTDWNKPGDIAYDTKRKAECKPDELKDDDICIKQGDSTFFVRNEAKYKKRFENFSKFYETIKGKPYSLEYEEQYTLDHFSEQNLLILGLNSAWHLDHCFKDRVTIHPGALNNALKKIRQNVNFQKCLKMVVWHHPVQSGKSDCINDINFMQRLEDDGFRIFIYGHIHKTSIHRYTHNDLSEPLTGIGAGTFGAPTKELVPGYPWQYNLLELNKNQIIVHTRKKEDNSGAWTEDLRWKLPEKEGKQSKYVINLGPIKEVLQPDWGDGPNVERFYGREEDLKILKRYIDKERLPLIILSGPVGMGRTTLAIKLGQELEANYEGSIIYRSFKGKYAKEVFPELDNCLKNHRSLLILDDIEERLGADNDKDQFHQSVLKLIDKQKNQSCVLVIVDSRTTDLSRFSLSGQFQWREHELRGFTEVKEVQDFLQRTIEGFPIDETAQEEDWKTLIRFCQGFPEHLKIIGQDARRFEYLSEFFATLNEKAYSKSELLRGLSLDDKLYEIIYWLAIKRESVCCSELRECFVTFEAKARLDHGLSTLVSLGVVEKKDTFYSLSDTFRKLATDNLIKEICDEIGIISDDLRFKGLYRIKFLNRYSLLEARADDHIREAQIDFIIKPILKSFDDDDIINKLKNILLSIQENSLQAPGYLAGNVINFLACLSPDPQNEGFSKLVNYDFSNLVIQQAYLKNVNLHSTNFSNSSIYNSNFLDTFSLVLSVSFSPSGDYFATSEFNGHIRLWHARDRKKVRTFKKEHSSQVWSISFSPNGQTLVSGGQDGKICLWNIDTGECEKTLSGGSDDKNHCVIRSVAFSPDGKFLISSDDHDVKLWEINNEKEPCVTIASKLAINVLSFNPNGSSFAGGAADGNVRLWSAQTRRRIGIFPRQSNSPIHAVAFSYDGSLLASAGGEEGKIYLWDAKKLQLKSILKNDSNTSQMTKVRSLAFQANGKYLASASDDRVIRLWNIDTGEPKLMTGRSAEGIHQKQYLGHTNRVRAIAFSPDDKTLISVGDDQAIKFWDVAEKKCVNTLQGYTNRFWSVVFSPDGKMLASGSDDGTVRLWNPEDGSVKEFEKKHKNWVWSVAFSLDGRTLASSSEDGKIYIWDVRTCTFLGDGLGSNEPDPNTQQRIRSITFSPDGRLLASASNDGTIKVWNVKGETCLENLQHDKERVLSVAFSRDGKMASSGKDKTVCLWHPEEDEDKFRPGRRLEGHTDQVHSVAFSPNGEKVVSASFDREIRIWDVNTGECLNVLEGHTDQILSIAFSPDGQLLASGSHDKTIRIWNATDGQLLHVLEGHEGAVEAVCFRPESKLLVSCSQDETIQLWDVTDGKWVKTLQVDKPYQGMNITGVKGLTDYEKDSLKALGAI